MQQPYEFELVNEQTNEYVFLTDSGLSYDVAFIKTETYFQSTELFINRAFELIIQPSKNQVVRPLKDSRIPITVAFIFEDFFKNHEKIIKYTRINFSNKFSINGEYVR